MSGEAAPRRRLPAPSVEQIGLAVLLAAFVLLLAVRGQLGEFFRLDNLRVLLYSNTVQAMAALAMLLIIISGGIDLSIGSVVALVAAVVVQSYRLVHDGPSELLPPEALGWLGDRGLLPRATGSPGLASAAALAAGLAAGLLCGLGNGLAVTRLRVPAFVATLGMMSIARGLELWILRKNTVTFKAGTRPGWVDALLRLDAGPFGFNWGIWLVAVVAVLLVVVLRFTVFGRYCYAIGSNEATARLCGVRVERQQVAVYLLGGLFAFLAGVLALTKGNGAGPDTGNGLELEVIAAVVIGGASLQGGEGGVAGALLGVLLLGLLEYGLRAVDVSLDLKYIVIGAVVVAKMALTQWQRRRG